MLVTAEEAVCSRCGGRGWVVEPDGGAGSARPCSCRDETRSARLLEAAAIPEHYGICTLEKFKPGGHPQLVEALSICRRYLDDYLALITDYREMGLLFIGPPGVGKTHLAVSVLKEVIRRYRVRGRFADFSSLIRQIQATFDPASSQYPHHILDPVINADLLLLDELGAQKPTSWVNEILNLIINRRYGQHLPTLFTTNYRLSSGPERRSTTSRTGAEDPSQPHSNPALQLSSRISPMATSRLHEMARPVVMDAAEDFREQVGRLRLQPDEQLGDEI